MIPEPIVLEHSDGETITGRIELKGGYLVVEYGFFTITLRPAPVIRTCRRILEILDPKGTRVPAAEK